MLNTIYEILDDNDKVINKIYADADFVQEHYPGRHRLVGIEPPILPDKSEITKLAMITRFLESEYAGILSASKFDMEVQAWLDRFYASTKIDLKDERTVNGINMMVSKGLLVPARATEILTAPVVPDEKV
jgi:hypothetical protein